MSRNTESTRAQDQSRPSLLTRIRGSKFLKDFSASEYRLNLLVAILIGVAGGYGAVGFRYAIGGVEKLAFGVINPTVEALSVTPWYIRFFLPILGGLLVGPLVSFFASEAKGHGVPEVMAAVATRGGIIRGRVAAVKVAASAITIGTGGSAGSEGPIVQIGSGIASWMGQFLHVSARRLKTYVGCGAAAGIAATFNAPVAGMLFSLEIILGDFGVTQLSSIIISSVVATAVSRAYLGDAPAFSLPEYVFEGPSELIHYAILGVFAGMVAWLFIRTLHSSEKFFDGLKIIPDWLKPAIGGLIIGCFGVLGMTHVYGVGYEFIEEALLGHLPFKILIFLVFAKIVATSATLGSGGSGGIFAPSLFLGAMLGGVVWYGADWLTPELVTDNYGAYALVGMAAVVAATTHAPMQAILILFELTGSYEVILPLMLSSILAVIVAQKLLPESIYTIKLKEKGIQLWRGKEVNVLKSIIVGDVMRSDAHTISHSMRLKPLLDEVSRATLHSTMFVVDDKGQLEGYISFHEIRAVLFDIEALEPILVVDDIANKEVPRVIPTDNLDYVFRLFGEKNLDELPVVDPHDANHLLGAIHRTDVVEAYNNEIMMRDLSGGVHSSIDAAKRLGSTLIAPGFVMAEIEAPAHYVGKNLRQLDLRSSEGIEVFIVRRHNPAVPGKGESMVPTADMKIEHGDVLLVSGPKEIVEKLAIR
ncbi:chloride channel protein [bacterium]|nr:chloride channel protein [bacterium]